MNIYVFICYSQTISAIRDGLSDPLVRTGHKLSLHQRALRMKESASFKKYRLQLRELPTIQVQDVKHVSWAVWCGGIVVYRNRRRVICVLLCIGDHQGAAVPS